MSRFCNIAISVFFSLVLLGPALVVGCERADVTLPSWATAEDARYLSGGQASADIGSNLNLAGFRSGDFQAALEVELENRIPFKAAAIVGNASLQRLGIIAANLPFGWDVYPTYYDSARFYHPGSGIMFGPPDGYSEAVAGKLEAFGSKLSALARDYPDVTFVVLVAERAETTPANPVRAHLSGPAITTHRAADIIGAQLVGDNESAMCVSYDDIEGYGGHFFRSDHHWNSLGAVDAYNRVMEELGRSAFPSYALRVVDGPRYYGYTARSGRMLVPAQPMDLDYDFAIDRAGVSEEQRQAERHAKYEDANELGKQWAFYDLYYSFPAHLDGRGTSRLLLVADSYGNSMKQPLTVAFESVDCRGYLPAGDHIEGRLRDDIDAVRPDVVLLVAHQGNFQTVLDRCPHMLD